MLYCKWWVGIISNILWALERYSISWLKPDLMQKALTYPSVWSSFVFLQALNDVMQRPAHVCECVCGWGGIDLSVIKYSSSSASFPCQPACLGIERRSVCLLQRLHSFNWSLLIDGRWVMNYCSLLWPVAVWGYSQLWVDILSVTEAVCVFLGMPETPNYPLSPRIVVFGT